MFGKTNIANHQLALRTIININYHKPSSSSLWSSKSSTSMISDHSSPPIRPWQWASRSKPQEQTWFSWKKREKSANLDLIYPNQHLSSGFLFESSISQLIQWIEKVVSPIPKNSHFHPNILDRVVPAGKHLLFATFLSVFFPHPLWEKASWLKSFRGRYCFFLLCSKLWIFRVQKYKTF